MAKRQSATWAGRYRGWLNYVNEVVRASDRGRKIALGPARPPLVRPETRAKRKGRESVVVCAPHPDDETLTCGLALRMSLEDGARVTDCAITLGSNLGQRARRLRELESACRVLGFELVVPEASSGFSNVNLENRRERPDEWRAKVETLAQTFDRLRPDVVFAPHAEDWNTTHIGTHFLAVEALGLHLERSGREMAPLILTEFWHELSQPNLMVGLSSETVAISLVAAAEHAGEMRRNPYHLRQPARLMNNVRRGSEVVGGQGGPARPFAFAELYRFVIIDGSGLRDPKPGGCVIGPKERLSFSSIVKRFLPDQ